MLNRVQSVHDDDLTVLAEFQYVGFAMPVVTKLPEPGVERRWKKLAGEPVGDAGDPYTGYDRFGRTEQMRWYKVDGESYDPLVSVQWGYNRASLKTWHRDLLAPAGAAQDQNFGYDGLYQVIQRQRGLLNINTTAVSGTPAQQEGFAYDETGNWVTYQQANDGTLDIDQSRENNVSNQITEIDGSGAGLSYDLNGNMLLVPTTESLEGPSRQLVWDAWNRLRIVKDHEDNVLGECQYDGQTRRTASEAGGVVRHFYYNDRWRSVEERLDAVSTAESQYVWYPSDRWELILRDRSTENNGTLDERLYSLKDQLDPVAVCDEEGTVVERYAYSAFGLTTVLDAEFEPDVASTVAWPFLFHGEFRDVETEWYNYGYRYYVSELGLWTSRDPLKETGGANLFSFVENDPANQFDILGLEKGGNCRCGKEIGVKLASLVENIDRYFADLGTGKRASFCLNSMSNPRDGWDIVELFTDSPHLTVPAKKCGVQECARTVMVQGRCYDGPGVNYILWGVLNRNCGGDELLAINLVDAHRTAMSVLKEGEEKELASRTVWTHLGFHKKLKFEGILPTRVPSSIEPDKLLQYQLDRKLFSVNQSADRTSSCPDCGEQYAGTLNAEFNDGVDIVKISSK